MMYNELIDALRCCYSVGCQQDCPRMNVEFSERVGGMVMTCDEVLMRDAADAIERLVKERDELQEQVYLLKPNDKISEYQAAMFAEMEIENKRLQAQVPRWIPVTERLPENEGRYLAIFYEEMIIDFGYYRPSVGWCEQGITHWMPLPKPPVLIDMIAEI